MADDIDGIQDPRYHIIAVGHYFVLYLVRGFAGAWMSLLARNPSPSERATLNSQSTCQGPRPGPKLACGVRAGSLHATEPRERGKTRGRHRKKCRRAKKTHVDYILSIFIYTAAQYQFLFCSSLPKSYKRNGSREAKKYTSSRAIWRIEAY